MLGVHAVLGAGGVQYGCRGQRYRGAHQKRHDGSEPCRHGTGKSPAVASQPAQTLRGGASAGAECVGGTGPGGELPHSLRRPGADPGGGLERAGTGAAVGATALALTVVGELLVDAPSAGEGYWNQRSKSRQTFEGHWTRTGDKYIRDADGRYTFCGRSDDMFKVSGIWVSPFEVESALITHPAVLEAAVVPEADPEGLLKPKAFVVLRADADTDGLHEALKEHVKQKIGPWKYPRWIDVVDSLPKTATGKIQRFKLREHN